MARARADEAQARADRLAERLRALGVDPEAEYGQQQRPTAANEARGRPLPAARHGQRRAIWA